MKWAMRALGGSRVESLAGFDRALQGFRFRCLGVVVLFLGAYKLLRLLGFVTVKMVGHAANS